MLVKIVDGAVDRYPYSIDQLKRDNPNRAFSNNIPEEILNSLGAYTVVHASTPSYDNMTQRIETSNLPVLVDGVWTITRTVVELTDEQKIERVASVASYVRSMRNNLLESKIDKINAVRWASLTADEQASWTTYRQALLDITAQAGFPSSVTWPTAPDEN